MQSFKQFLIEASDSYYFYVSSSIENMKIDFLDEFELEQQIKQELKTQYKYKICNINYWQQLAKLTLSIACDKNTVNDLAEVKNTLYTYLTKYFNTKDVLISDGHAYLEDINYNFLIKADKIVIASPISLKGIHTKVECKTLEIMMPSKTVEGGLGILKIKNIERLVTNKEEQWDIIVKKYIRSKDLLACQDELIENGLKEYARV